MNSNVLHKEWVNRPDDQRFLSMAELHAFNTTKKQESKTLGVALDHLQIRAVEDDVRLQSEADASIPGASFSNWGFGQLCQRAHAPAGYLRSLPAELAVIPLQWSMEQEREDARLFVRENGVGARVNAVTSDTYGRIYDADVSEAVLKYVDPAAWKVPAASYASTNPRKATTLYASDRDSFICLVNDTNPVEVRGANGQPDRLFRGFIVRNSEVGAAALEFLFFLYRYICDNRTIWGMTGEQRIAIRHTSGGPMRFIHEAQPALTRYLTAATADTAEAIHAAQEQVVGADKPKVVEWLKARGFTGSLAERAVAKAEADETVNPRSLWGVVNGLTAAAQDERFGDVRLDVERQASKLLARVQ